MAQSKKPGKIGEEQKALISAFLKFVIALPKTRYLENRFETKLYPHVFLKFLIF